MAALDFPSSPTDGQQYEGYTYDSTKGAWQWDVVEPTIANLNDTVVGSPEEGDVLVYNGSAWVNGDPPPGNNLLYNGAMQVAQRGTSATGLGNGDNGYHTADRWVFSEGGTPTWEFTQTVEADAPTGSGFSKSLKMECTTADASLSAGGALVILQNLEGQDLQKIKKGTSSAESLTLSFWVKSDVTGNYVAELFDQDNSRLIAAVYAISSSATWEKKTITFDGDTTGAFTDDNNTSLQVRFWLLAGTDFTSGTLQTTWGARVDANRAVGQTNLAASTSNYWQVTGVQLETGTVATGFDHKPYGVELAECQRYYYRFVNGNAQVIANGASYVAGSVYGVVHFPVPLRTESISFEQTTGTGYYRLFGNGTGDLFDSFNTLDSTSLNAGRIHVNSGISSVQGYAYILNTTNADSFLAVDAEL